MPKRGTTDFRVRITPGEVKLKAFACLAERYTDITEWTWAFLHSPISQAAVHEKKVVADGGIMRVHICGSFIGQA
ncbi:MAG: DUF4368 domain-containing protein [Clostridia bacterium]|nr:DUF4368 domain-containing protein [Clostridia bacterium]